MTRDGSQGIEYVVISKIQQTVVGCEIVVQNTGDKQHYYKYDILITLVPRMGNFSLLFCHQEDRILEDKTGHFGWRFLA